MLLVIVVVVEVVVEQDVVVDWFVNDKNVILDFVHVELLPYLIVDMNVLEEYLDRWVVVVVVVDVVFVVTSYELYSLYLMIMVLEILVHLDSNLIDLNKLNY